MIAIAQIKTSAKNKELVTQLTRKFALGAENVIARIAIAYSLQSGIHFSPLDIKDSGGKEYSKNVTATAEKIVFSEPTNTFSDGNQMTSDDIIKYVPQTLPIDGDDCTFNLTMMTIDGEPKFVVTYERTTDGWPCKSFYASTLRYVLNDVALYAAEGE